MKFFKRLSDWLGFTDIFLFYLTLILFELLIIRFESLFFFLRTVMNPFLMKGVLNSEVSISFLKLLVFCYLDVYIFFLVNMASNR